MVNSPKHPSGIRFRCYTATGEIHARMIPASRRDSSSERMLKQTSPSSGRPFGDSAPSKFFRNTVSISFSETPDIVESSGTRIHPLTTPSRMSHALLFTANTRKRRPLPLTEYAIAPPHERLWPSSCKKAHKRSRRTFINMPVLLSVIITAIASGVGLCSRGRLRLRWPL